MLGGPIVFDEKGQNPNQKSAVVQNLGGEPVVVLPKNVAPKQLVFPAPSFKART